jgi:hypothetical protein
MSKKQVLAVVVVGGALTGYWLFFTESGKIFLQNMFGGGTIGQPATPMEQVIAFILLGGLLFLCFLFILKTVEKSKSEPD